MKCLLLIIAAMGALLTGALAQTVDDPNEGCRLTRDSASGEYTLAWWSRSGRTYFIQQTDDLLHPWAYIPIIEPGADAVIEYGFTSTSSRFFLRLRWTDFFTDDPFTADFDGDKVNNWDELQIGTDPLSAKDTAGLGLPDDWQMKYFGHTGIDPTAIDSTTGLTYLQDFIQGRTPGAGTTTDHAESVALEVYTPLQ